MKKLVSMIAVGLMLAFGQAHAADAKADCAAKAAEKKLAGAAKTSFEKKCVADAGGAAAAEPASSACEKTAAEKKLAGAAKSSFMKKCVADEKAGAKPEAKPEAAKPAASAAPAAAKPAASAAPASAKPAAAAAPAASADKKMSQQDKMKLCNAEAKGLKGDDFKKKRDDCLKK